MLNTVNHAMLPRLVTQLTATGTNQAGALPLTNNAHHEIATVPAGTGVILPYPELPSSVSIYNRGSNALLVYPAVGGTINTNSTNASVSVAAGTGVMYWASSPTTWDDVQTPSSSGGSGTVTSVGMTAPSWLTVAGSPITGSGTLAVSATTGQTANEFLATPNGSTGAVGLRTIVAADLPTTGLTITQHAAAVTVDAPSAGAVTSDLSVSDAHSVTMAVSTTITLANAPSSKRQVSTFYLIQGGSGSCVPTFTPTVHYGAAGTPTWSTTVGKMDIVSIDWDGTTFRGALVGTGF